MSSLNSELPMTPERLIGAACTLNSTEMRMRLTEWRGLRDRARAIEAIDGGARLDFEVDEPLAPIGDWWPVRRNAAPSTASVAIKVGVAAEQAD